MSPGELWHRFRQRKIASWTVAYVTVAVALFGTLETVGSVFEWDPAILRAVFFLLVSGFVVTVLLAWFHGEKGRQGVDALEAALLAGAAGFGLFGAGWTLRSANAVADETAEVEPTPAVVRASSAPAALAAFERGEDLLKQRTPAAVIEAIGEYREASSLDAGMAAAKAREAYAYGLFVDWGWTFPGIDDRGLLQRGLELSDAALAIDSVSPEGWLARAYLLQLSDPDHPEVALGAFARAVELDPANPEAHHQYGQTLMISGRFAEARAAYHAALAIDGGRPLTLVALSAIEERSGDPETARRWADSAVVLADQAPYAWASRGLSSLIRGAFSDAADDARRALRIDPSYELPARSILGAALWHEGERDGGLTELQRSRRAIVNPDEPGPTDAYYLGAALASIGRLDESLALIEAARPRSRWLWFYLQSPAFDALRDRERFGAVLDDAVDGGGFAD